jgi:hypothetical protein
VKLITIKLAHRPGMKPMPSWPAFEVPGTQGLLAVHRTPCENGDPHFSHWSATHVPSGYSVPVPANCDRERATWYATTFYTEANQLGVDLRKVAPLDTLEVDKVRRLLGVFCRRPPETVSVAGGAGSRSQAPVEHESSVPEFS